MKLKYFNTIWREYQWFLLYEFQVSEIDLFKSTDQEILTAIIGTNILGNVLFHSEMENKAIEVSVQNVSRPFNFKKVTVNDFKFLESRETFETWVDKFSSDDWEDDREDAQILIAKAVNEIQSRTNFKNGFWHLSREKLEDNSEKLANLHWVYLHFETFIEIDRTNNTIRTFDFGYD